MRRVADADTHSFTSRLDGTFTPTEELNRDAGTAQLRNRYLALLLEAMRHPSDTPPPTWQELTARW